MAGLWVAHVDVLDEDAYGAYVKQATEVLSSHGATFIARGGRYQQMEGRDRPRNVIARFDTFDDAVSCYESDEYQAIARQAIAASDRTVVIVETDD
jgi:uncharacterized protein (DUF1330 family)